MILNAEKKMIKLPHKKLHKFFLKKVKYVFLLAALIRLMTKFDSCIVLVQSASYFLYLELSQTVLSM